MDAPQEQVEVIDALARAFENRNVVVFAGAGVSISPPAGLPNWLELRDWTLEAVASRADFLAPLLPTLTSLDALPVTGRKGMTPEVVASEIAKECAGYFESLRVLDDGTPNINHQLIARLAKAGSVRAVVTTNFDIFIERALQAEGVEFDVYRGQDEFSQFPVTAAAMPARVSVLKIHGCLTRPETIIATIETQARGLMEHHRFVLRWLQERCYFLYWGYSGWDLKVNLDYLGAISAKDLAPGFFWSLHQDAVYKETASPYVLELQQTYGSRGHVGHRLATQAAAQALRPLGGAVLDELILTPDQLRTWREGKNARLRERLRSWARDSVSEVAALQIFGSLLSIGGKGDEAQACFSRVEEIATASGDALLLAHVSQRAGQAWSARGYRLKALECLRRTEAIAREHDVGPMLAASLDGIATVLSGMGQQDAALDCLREAARLVATNDPIEQRGDILDSMGDICSARSQFNEALTFHKQAERVFRATGAKRSLAACLNKQAHLHRLWGEFDNARKCLQESLTIGRDILGDPRAVTDARLLIAVVNLADKKLDVAYDDLTALVTAARRDGAADVLLNAQLHLRVVEQFRGNLAEARAIRKDALEWLRGAQSPAALSTLLLEYSQDVLPIEGPQTALKLCEEARDLAVEASDFLRAAFACEAVGDLLAGHLHHNEEAVVCFQSSITYHRRVEQDDDPFVPRLLMRIAECRNQAPLDATEALDAAVAAEPLIAPILQSAAPDEPASAYQRIYAAIMAIRRLTTVANLKNREHYVRYLNAELRLSRAIGFRHHVATALADLGWAHVVAENFEEGLPLLRSATQMSHDLGDTEGEILHRGNLGFALGRSGDAQAEVDTIAEAMNLARGHHFRVRLLWLLQEQARWYKTQKDERATPFFKEAIDLAEETSNLELASSLSFDLGKVYRDIGQFERALHYRLRGLRALDALGVQSQTCPRLIVIANMLENDLAQPENSLPYYERALALCGRDPDVAPQVLGLYQRALGKLPGGSPKTPVHDALSERYGDTHEAAEALARWARHEGLEIIAEQPTAASRIASVGMSTRKAVGTVLLANARAFMKTGDAKGAMTHLQDAERIARELGDRQWLGTVRRCMGDFFRAAGYHEYAMQAYEEAERIAVISGNTEEVDIVRYTMAHATYERGDTEAALLHIEVAIAAAREAKYPFGVARNLMLLAEIVRARNEPERAEQSLFEAARMFEEQQRVPKWAEAHIRRAEILTEMGRRTEALDAFRIVEEIVMRDGNPASRERVTQGIARAQEQPH
jgi:tetratricopeptide (TPR) repeat protein